MTGKEYRSKRKKLRMTQQQLAESLQVSKPTIVRREKKGFIDRESEIAINHLVMAKETTEELIKKQPSRKMKIELKEVLLMSNDEKKECFGESFKKVRELCRSVRSAERAKSEFVRHGFESQAKSSEYGILSSKKALQKFLDEFLEHGNRQS